MQLDERFRFTGHMMHDGRWNFTVIGLHTTFEVIGFLQTISQMLEQRAINQRQPDLVKELINIGD